MAHWYCPKHRTEPPDGAYVDAHKNTPSRRYRDRFSFAGRRTPLRNSRRRRPKIPATMRMDFRISKMPPGGGVGSHADESHVKRERSERAASWRWELSPGIEPRFKRACGLPTSQITARVEMESTPPEHRMKSYAGHALARPRNETDGVDCSTTRARRSRHFP